MYLASLNATIKLNDSNGQEYSQNAKIEFDMDELWEHLQLKVVHEIADELPFNLQENESVKEAVRQITFKDVLKRIKDDAHDE